MNNIILFVTCLALASSALAADETETEFHYVTGAYADPSKWSSVKQEWKICGVGKRQSPVNLSPKVARLVHNSTALIQTYYRPVEATLKNRGYDIMVSWQEDAGKLVINNTDYKLVQSHWHAPSEHFLNGKRLAMELHMVHKSADGHLAVIGVLLREGEPNAFISRIMDKINLIADILNGEASIGKIDPREFGWDLTNFYEYRGSLTTPPCTEDVIWTIVNKVLGTVSREQIDILVDARRAGYEANARPAQPLYKRMVYLNEQSTPSASALTPYLRLYSRLMASRPRLFSNPLSPPLHRHSSSLSSPLFSSLSPRINIQLTKVLSQGLIQRNAISSRSFMSSTISTEAFQESATSKGYSSEQIQVLEGLDPVRKRPGMYIGSTGPRGLHHLVYEILDNAIDEAQAGYASKVDVVLHADGSVSIMDNGRGIPTDLHPVTNKSSLETVLTVLHAGGKFGGTSSGYSVSGGLHGVGLSVVNALSEALEVTVWRDGVEHKQSYSRGKPITILTRSELPLESKGTKGTSIRFWPDKEVFTTAIEFDHNTIAGRIRELAFLNPKVTITLQKEDEDPEKNQYTEYFYAGGLKEYVSWLNADKSPIHDVLGFRKEINGASIDVALQWCSDAYSDTMLGYANSIRTIDGGTHIEGVKASLTRTLNSLAKKSKTVKEKDINLNGEHVREGLTCIVSVKIPNPEFEGQTKTRLGNPEVRKIVDQSVQEYLTEYLELHPDVLESIISKSLNAYKAALAAKRARELIRSKSVLKSSSLPGKLADCSSTNPEESEIFIVEGDSAGGSAKQGRDRRFQAILPLRGKILNIERKDEAAMYKNEEIQNLILGLGLGVKGEDFKMENLRYHKIIILTDADVDGAHIRTLLLTFFFRYQRALFDAGCIYVGVPPLFKVERGKQAQYCYDDADLKKITADFPSNASYNIQRFKGLGEMMPEQLWETTMNPETRILKQLVVDDIAEANMTFSSLMGARVDARKELIKNAATRINLQHLDI
ncbi:hypothetical protein Bca52824_021770 [Brassica carinata]|uniref:DNA gyrase subunit B n=1 Tax=Brassica carinata TaxID=52824 RepID=A0A8X7VFG7_BRACI|nr:hypothetical protein Bca52824_021770 [Brassica carinata]